MKGDMPKIRQQRLFQVIHIEHKSFKEWVEEIHPEFTENELPWQVRAVDNPSQAIKDVGRGVGHGANLLKQGIGRGVQAAHGWAKDQYARAEQEAMQRKARKRL